MCLEPMKGGNEIEKSIEKTIEFIDCICNGIILKSFTNNATLNSASGGNS